MDAPSSELSPFQELRRAFSFKRCLFFFLLFVILIIIAFGIGAIFIFFVLKPQTPIFSLQTVNIDSYKLDVFSRSSLFVSSIVSLTLNAQNPNKVGIRYSSSRLHVLDDEGLVIGLIRIPGFYQPAKSSNISVPTRIIFDSLNVTKILSGLTQKDESNKSTFMVKILGDIEAHLRLLHIKVPKLKVALDCDVGIDYKYLTFSNGVNSLKTFQKHLAGGSILSTMSNVEPGTFLYEWPLDDSLPAMYPFRPCDKKAIVGPPQNKAPPLRGLGNIFYDHMPLTIFVYSSSTNTCKQNYSF